MAVTARRAELHAGRAAARARHQADQLARSRARRGRKLPWQRRDEDRAWWAQIFQTQSMAPAQGGDRVIALRRGLPRSRERRAWFVWVPIHAAIVIGWLIAWSVTGERGAVILALCWCLVLVMAIFKALAWSLYINASTSTGASSTGSAPVMGAPAGGARWPAPTNPPSSGAGHQHFRNRR